MSDELMCGEREGFCGCVAAPCHDGPHECDCGGSWEYVGGEFCVVVLPFRSVSNKALRGPQEKMEG